MAPVRYDRDQDIAVLTIDNPPVNALGQPVRAGLLAALARAEADPQVKALLLTGAGRAFIAGADIREFGKPLLAPELPDICARLENSPLLVVASLHGVALGGGLEIALSAHYRVAQPTARVGFPEVNLGLIPGAGGTQRLPRLTGARAAIDLITKGRPLTASQALDLGIIDQITTIDEARAAGVSYTRLLLEQSAPRRPISKLPAPAPIDWDRTYDETLTGARGQIAPAYAVRAVQASAEMPFDEGIREERRLFLELMQSDQRRAMIHAFFAERASGATPEIKDVTPRQIEDIGVVGGGTMGAGIATAALLSGLNVTLLETSAAAVETTRDRIAQNLEEALLRGKITNADYEKALAEKLVLDTADSALAQADVVIEAVFEDMALKKAVFARLDAVCKPGAVIATNTSYLDINEIANATARPQDVLGLHFFSPAHVMKLLEVVVSDRAAPQAVATGFALAKRLGKIAVQSGVGEGFIGNRILTTNRRTADSMVLQGASPAQIDAALMEFGFAMGPYAVADLAGLDIGWNNRKRLMALRGPRVGQANFPDRLCEAGHFGRKTGKGYYLYGKDVAAGTPNPKVLTLIEAERDERGMTPRDFTASEIISRYMAAMVNEAARVIDEGIARRPLDVDLVLITGYGFPRHRGGPCKWADLKGLSALLSEIESFAAQDPEQWSPAPLLDRLVNEGRSFGDLNRMG